MVGLYIRSDGRHSFLEPAWNRNHTLRPGYTLVAGKPTYFAHSVYYLRFLRGGKRVWQAVGAEPDGAIVALRNAQHDLEAVALGKKIPNPAAMSNIESPQSATIGELLVSESTELSILQFSERFYLFFAREREQALQVCVRVNGVGRRDAEAGQ